jgi:toxin ParE1/3/4
MRKYKVEFSRRANAQIRNIFSYIAQDNATAALKMVDTIEERVNQLATAPMLGIELPEDEYPFLTPGYRRLVVSPFLVYYRVMEDTVYITHIVHERRNQQKALTTDKA